MCLPLQHKHRTLTGSDNCLVETVFLFQVVSFLSHLIDIHPHYPSVHGKKMHATCTAHPSCGRGVLCVSTSALTACLLHGLRSLDYLSFSVCKRDALSWSCLNIKWQKVYKSTVCGTVPLRVSPVFQTLAYWYNLGSLLTTVDIWGCPGHCGGLRSIPGSHPCHARSTSSHDNHRCAQMLPRAPWGQD